ncbi:Aldehyde/histidinol dehydrogenase [Panaeolus papilionaceus]|nr:Aldehyde/histidinol dehydrogenase [Panaeolus papilionaceus]
MSALLCTLWVASGEHIVLPLVRSERAPTGAERRFVFFSTDIIDFIHFLPRPVLAPPPLVCEHEAVCWLSRELLSVLRHGTSDQEGTQGNRPHHRAIQLSVWLLLSPLAGALAAGNTDLLKPSESTPAKSALLAEVVAKYLDKDVVRVIKWRYSRDYQAAAAKHLTPVFLELGGKSPVIVDSTCDLKTTAKRLLWGKTVNAGQTCVAPDYVLVPREFQDTLVNALKEVYEEFYPDASLRAGAPEAYSRIVTPQATNRIAGLLENTQGTVVVGGEVDKASKFIAPTIVKDVKATDSLMSQEIFGPILPTVPVDDIDEAIKFVNEQYMIFDFAFIWERVAKYFFNKTQSSAAVANEVVIHTGADGLPFGGVGPSGLNAALDGMHTGIYSFEMFTHLRASLDSPSWVDAVLKFRYPPYTESKANAAMRLLGSLPARPTGPPSAAGQKWWGKWFIVAFAIAIAAALLSDARCWPRWLTSDAYMHSLPGSRQSLPSMSPNLSLDMRSPGWHNLPALPENPSNSPPSFDAVANSHPTPIPAAPAATQPPQLQQHEAVDEQLRARSNQSNMNTQHRQPSQDPTYGPDSGLRLNNGQNGNQNGNWYG